jgi:hypothetical protein
MRAMQRRVGERRSVPVKTRGVDPRNIGRANSVRRDDENRRDEQDVAGAWVCGAAGIQDAAREASRNATGAPKGEGGDDVRPTPKRDTPRDGVARHEIATWASER